MPHHLNKEMIQMLHQKLNGIIEQGNVYNVVNTHAKEYVENKEEICIEERRLRAPVGQTNGKLLILMTQIIPITQKLSLSQSKHVLIC